MLLQAISKQYGMRRNGVKHIAFPSSITLLLSINMRISLDESITLLPGVL